METVETNHYQKQIDELHEIVYDYQECVSQIEELLSNSINGSDLHPTHNGIHIELFEEIQAIIERNLHC